MVLAAAFAPGRGAAQVGEPAGASRIPPAASPLAAPPDAGAPVTPQPLAFADFFQAPIGARGPLPTERLRALDGQRIVIEGFMAAQERPTPGFFWLASRPVLLSEHADGMADDLPAHAMAVFLGGADASVTPLPTRGPLRLTGVLRLGRAELPDGRVGWIRLLLDPRPGAPLAATHPDPASDRRP